MAAYSLVIADDDEILLEGLATAFDWSSLNVRVAAAVTDGAAALRRCAVSPRTSCSPTSRWAYGRAGADAAGGEEFPGVRLVIMSAYEEFGFAQHAVRMGVEDYLVKPSTWTNWRTRSAG